MILIRVAVLFLLVFEAVAQKKVIDFGSVKKEIEWYIGEIKEKYSKSSIYNVYGIRFMTECDGYCFTITYVMDGSDVQNLNALKRFFRFGGEIILIDFTKDFLDKYVFKSSISFEDLKNRELIYNKIYRTGAFTGIREVYVCCYTSDKIEKTFYSDSDKVPADKNILDYTQPSLPFFEVPDTTIRIDEEILRNVERDNKK